MTIQQFANEIGVKTLVHFTRESNLDSIFERGLVPRNMLASERFEGFNDAVRADRTDAVCVSIGFPNYKMWYQVKEKNKGLDWVVLAIAPRALWELNCAFCSANAALAAIAAIPLAQRQTLPAFRGMYADVPGKERARLGIPAWWPTNPQAEVLMLQGVPRGYILGVITLNPLQDARIKQRYPGVQTQINAAYFRYRKDYEFWKAGA